RRDTEAGTGGKSAALDCQEPLESVPTVDVPGLGGACRFRRQWHRAVGGVAHRPGIHGQGEGLEGEDEGRPVRPPPADAAIVGQQLPLALDGSEPGMEAVEVAPPAGPALDTLGDLAEPEAAT